MRARRVVATVTAAALAASLIGVSVAEATMAFEASASHTIETATLASPTSPAAVAGTCIAGVSDSIVVTWTKTASTWAEGYEILRSTTSGGPYAAVAKVTGHGTESYEDGLLAFSTTYYYVITATKHLWRSPPTVEVSKTTRSTLCT